MEVGNIESPLKDTSWPLLNTILLDTIFTFLKDLRSFCLRTCYYWKKQDRDIEKHNQILSNLSNIKQNRFFTPLQ